jgi:hypothetical protein
LFLQTSSDDDDDDDDDGGGTGNEGSENLREPEEMSEGNDIHEGNVEQDCVQETKTNLQAVNENLVVTMGEMEI